MADQKKKQEKKKPELSIEYIKELVKKAAKDNVIHPSNVTVAMLKIQDDNVTEWSLRQFGGMSGVKKYFPVTEKDLAEINKQKDIQAYINKLEKQLGNQINFEDQILKTIRNAIERLNPQPYVIPKFVPKLNKKNMTMELMLSDIHFGKKSESFDLSVLKTRLAKLTDIFLSEIKFKQDQGYNVERLVISLLGDIMESYTMHGSESSLSCEFGNPKQIYTAIKVLFDQVFLPIAKTGIKIDVPAVAGNHDRTEVHRTFNNPGENYMTWVIYNCLKDYCQIAGLTNIKFDIPICGFTTVDIYGHTMLIEHLDNLKSTAKGSLDDLITDRSKQLGVQIKMIRGGHWHEYVCYERGRAIINESVCGQDSYAKVKGYSSTAGQTINFYVDDKKLPNAFLYSYPVFLE
jgi:hypothetical protein